MRKFAACICALAALPAAAQQVTWTLPEDGSAVAIIHFDNIRKGGGVRGYTIETSHGPIVLRHIITPNVPVGTECCADTLEVIDHPAGTVAIPPGIELGEGLKADIVIREWEGM